jgi:parallel beta-helix repeat protein
VSRGHVLASGIILLLISLSLAVRIREADASGTIYIRANGLVEGTDKITSLDSIIYTFTDNIYDSIVIERDNIVVDGADYTLQGTEDANGIDLSSRNNVTIKNMQIADFERSILLNGSMNNMISENTMIGIERGILLQLSSSNIITGNTIKTEAYSIAIDNSSNHNTISWNNMETTGLGWGGGISIVESHYTTIADNNITTKYCISQWKASHSTISGNNITAYDGTGLELDYSSDNTISHNTFKYCGLKTANSYQNTFADNTVNGKPLVYLEDVSDLSVEDAGQVVLVNCDSITLRNLVLYGNEDECILLWATNNTAILENSISGRQGRVRLVGSMNNNISRNDLGTLYLNENSSENRIIENNMGDLQVWSSSNNIVHGNNVTGGKNNLGIGLSFHSDNNLVFSNNVTETGYGIVITYSSLNRIFSNNVIDNSVCGFYVDDESNDNTIFRNNIINNTEQVMSFGGSNYWDNGFEGNYWSNYTGVDLNHDGIGDSHHVIEENNIDYFPLMGVHHSYRASEGAWVGIISNSTIEGFLYLDDSMDSGSTIMVYISNMTAGQTHGFCRIGIPKDLIAPPYQVTINDGSVEVLDFNDTVYETDMSRWIYFAYEHSMHEVAITPEIQTLTTILLALIAFTISLILTKRRLFKIQLQ